MFRAVVIFAALILATSAIESNFYREESCAQKSGYCLLAKECPNKNIGEEYEGLCPEQRSLGAICCKNYNGDLNCHQTHNECKKVSDCPKNLSSGRKGCANGETCCTLV